MDSRCVAKVSAKDFLKRRTQLNCFKLIRDEYYSIVTRPINKTITSFIEPENEPKNRYMDIPCWEHSRVVLDTLKDDRTTSTRIESIAHIALFTYFHHIIPHNTIN
ncbi:unnamed protein product [Euphydryas editha]|uniref:Uncharacterized protein n=1 Tax=Euphydryas editha TaxID=104508 RepID=A0AAU9TSC9_EUPED|nr:unnamed protein product [Euphydryas editha]